MIACDNGPFQQADLSTARRYGGAGLGLAINRELISLVGGTVSMHSVEGQGTSMTVEIELKKDLTSAGNGTADQDGTAQEADTDFGDQHDSNTNTSIRKPESVRILLAGDNKLLRDLYVRILRQRGFTVVAVADGQLSVDAVHSGKSFDLVLMDGQMPVKDGYQANREIRASTISTIQHIKIDALTASAFEGDRERCLAAGVDGYLSKPVKADALVQAIWQQLK
jgi:CheY-like chemotaxis protein